MPFKVADAPQWKLTAQSPILPIEKPAKDDFMDSKVQGYREHTARSVYHQGLIKLLIVSQFHREGRNLETLLTELGFEENIKEKGKRIMEDSDQQTTSHKKQIEAAVEEGKGFTEKPIQEGLCPKTSFTNQNPKKISLC